MVDVANIRLMNMDKQPFQVFPFGEISLLPKGEPFSLANDHLKATFGADGLLTNITTLPDKASSAVKMEFVTYGVRPKRGERPE